MARTFLDLIPLIGIAGAAMILAAYALLYSGRLTSGGLAYPLLNAAGAFLIILSLIVDFNLAAFIIEFFWLVISIYGIIRFAAARSGNPGT